MTSRRLTLGVAAVAVALLGWIVTQLAAPIAQKPHTTEDLTTAWNKAGPTRLGQPATVVVPPGQTLVAFLVGVDSAGDGRRRPDRLRLAVDQPAQPVTRLTDNSLR
jgi:hypothetical protein